MSKRFLFVVTIFLFLQLPCFTTASAAYLRQAQQKPEAPTILKIGVLLPFEGPDSRTAKMVEFYRGVLMAVDELTRSTDIDIDITALNSGETASEMGYLLAKHPELRDCQLIIGPQASAQVPALSEFCQINGIRLVVPFSNPSNQLCFDNMFVVSPPYASRVDEVTTLFASLFNGCNVIVLHTGDVTKGSSATSAAIINSRKRSALSTGELDISIDGNEEKLAGMVSDSLLNVFVIDGASLASANMAFASLDAVTGERQELKVAVVGTPEWCNYTQQHLHNYYRYNTYLPVTHFHNATSAGNIAFENNYIRTFGTPMLSSSPKFAPMGYDLAMLFVNAELANAETDADMLRLYIAQRPLQHGLLFTRHADGAFFNHSCKFVHYSQGNGEVPLYNIELLSR